VRFFGFFKGIPIDNLFTIQKSFKAHVKMWEMVLRLSTNFCVAVILESGTKFISQVLFKIKGPINVYNACFVLALIEDFLEMAYSEVFSKSKLWLS